MATPRNADYIKDYNRRTFLHILRAAPTTRSSIVKATGLSRTAVSLIADELLDEGFIEEMDGAPENARKKKNSSYLRMREGHSFAVGAYLNRDGCTAGIVDICGEVAAKRRLHLSGFRAGDKLDPLVDAVDDMIYESGVAPERIIGLGLSAPGPLDEKSGRILNPPRFDLWHNTAIVDYLKCRTDMPVYLENNTSCLARYNYKKPGTGGSEDYMLLLVDSGVGAGIVSGGHVLLGLGGSAGEFGHISISFKGERCSCGNYGCLETYAAIPVLLKGTSFDSWNEVVDSDSGEAADIIDRECEYLASGIVSAANLVNIDTVLLAGDILYGVERVMYKMEDIINSRTIRRNIQRIKVLPAFSGPDMKVRAAADIAFGRFLMI